jgi:hypothetical protein
MNGFPKVDANNIKISTLNVYFTVAAFGNPFMWPLIAFGIRYDCTSSFLKKLAENGKLNNVYLKTTKKIKKNVSGPTESTN